MSQLWDKISKLLIRRNPQAFVNLFLPEARVISLQPVGLEETDQEMDMLILAEIQGEETLVQIEVQTYNDKKMGSRLQRYNLDAWALHKKPVLSCVIYLLRKGIKPASPFVMVAANIEVHTFRFFSEEIGKWSAEQILARNELELLPFLPLTKDGLERELIEDMLNRLRATGDPELEVRGYGLAVLAFKHYTQIVPEWLSQRKEDMQDIWEEIQEIPLFYDIALMGEERGRQKGLQEGMERGMERGMKKGMKAGWRQGHEEGAIEEARKMVLEVVLECYPEAIEIASKQVQMIHEVFKLRRLAILIFKASDEATAIQYIHKMAHPLPVKSSPQPQPEDM